MSMNSQGNGDTSSDDLWMMAMFVAAIAGIIYFVPQIIIAPWKYLKIAELWVLDFMPLSADGAENARRAMDFLVSRAATDISWSQVSMINNYVGSYTAYLFAAILGAVGIFIIMRKTYNYSYDMDRLLAEQSKVWKRVKPWVNYQPHPKAYAGPMRSSQKPMEFVHENGLLIYPEGHSLAPGVKKRGPKPKNEPLPKFESEKCEALLIEQMGGYWEGPEKLKSYERLLFTLFATRICGGSEGKKKADAILDGAAEMIAEPKGDHSKTHELIGGLFQKYKNDPKIVEITQGHAYIKTVLAEMLERSRVNGVLASCDFLWLKRIDRGLWYMMNSVGRRSCFIECGGPWAHWIAERTIGRPLESPQVKEAVKAIRIKCGLPEK